MTNLPITGIFNITCEYKRKGNLWSIGYHTGIDLTGSDTIYATCDGVVSKTGYDKSYGNYIVIKNYADGNYHWFCHLEKIYVTVGTEVTRTKVIGLMGATGNVTGKHLHFEIRNKNNKYGDDLNPCNWLGIENKVASNLNSENYQLIIENEEKQNNPDTIKVGDIKKFGVKTNLREEPCLNSTPHLYKENTTVKILEVNVSNKDGYIWDKVEVIYANPDDFSIGYVARTCNRYK